MDKRAALLEAALKAGYSDIMDIRTCVSRIVDCVLEEAAQVAERQPSPSSHWIAEAIRALKAKT